MRSNIQTSQSGSLNAWTQLIDLLSLSLPKSFLYVDPFDKANNEISGIYIWSSLSTSKSSTVSPH
jgi:hypothetical protein